MLYVHWAKWSTHSSVSLFKYHTQIFILYKSSDSYTFYIYLPWSFHFERHSSIIWHCLLPLAFTSTWITDATHELAMCPCLCVIADWHTLESCGFTICRLIKKERLCDLGLANLRNLRICSSGMSSRICGLFICGLQENVCVPTFDI